jgi:hypothetical protein
MALASMVIFSCLLLFPAITVGMLIDVGSRSRKRGLHARCRAFISSFVRILFSEDQDGATESETSPITAQISQVGTGSVMGVPEKTGQPVQPICCPSFAPNPQAE